MDSIVQGTTSFNNEDIVSYYFHLKPKLTYKEIVKILNSNHGFNWSVRNFKDYCKKMGWSRKCFLNQTEINELVSMELSRSTSLTGYRQMRDYVGLRYQVHIPKEKVRQSLQYLDPEGVMERSRRTLKRRIYHTDGPFHVLHIDGNDKLKHWGISIHGGIDGFSRKIMWLACTSTNKDPRVVAKLFLSCVQRYNLTPKIIRADRGTENVHIEQFQQWFTMSEHSFKYGKSTRNQRIESLWSRLKKFVTSWWIDFFRNMESSNLLDTSLSSDIALVQFCFLPVIQSELNEFIKTWNLRHVRKSGCAPSGKPEMLFHFPHTKGFVPQGIFISNIEISMAKEILGFEMLPVNISQDYHELCECYVFLHGLSIQNNAETALDLFINLKNIMESEGLSSL